MQALNILLNCTNSYYVNKQDKIGLLEEMSLERNHMRYLLMKDPEIDEILKNSHV